MYRRAASGYGPDVPEHVVPLDVMARWDPNDPRGVLLATETGRTALALQAHRDDPDQRSVVLVWEGTRSAALAAPGEEALGGHRLFHRGLTDVRWIGVVRQSALIDGLAEIDRAHPRPDPAALARLVHHVVLLRDATVEVVADLLRVERVEGPTVAAAAAAVS